MKALVTSDSQFGKGRTLYPGRLADQETNWAQTLALAVDHACDLVIHAGDVYEDREPDSQVRAAFQRPLVGYGIPVVAVVGNHDVRAPALPTALETAGAELGGGLLQVARRPDVVIAGGCAIACLPWKSMAHLIAARNGHDRRSVYLEAEEHLYAIAEELHDRARRDHPGQPVLLVAHWALDAVWPASAPAHEPVLSLDRLQDVGFDAIVCGHVHAPGEWGNAISPGSPMCLDHGEAATEHGCWLLEVDAGETWWTFFPLEYRPFTTLDADGESLATGGGFGLPEVEGSIVRLRYQATVEQAHHIDPTAIEATLLAAGAVSVKIEPTIDRPSRARVVEASGDLDVLAALDLWIANREPPVSAARAEALREWTRKALA